MSCGERSSVAITIPIIAPITTTASHYPLLLTLISPETTCGYLNMAQEGGVIKADFTTHIMLSLGSLPPPPPPPPPKKTKSILCSCRYTSLKVSQFVNGVLGSDGKNSI